MSAKKKERKYKPYTYYRFTSYDPIIAKTLAMIDDRIASGAGQRSYSAVAKDAGLSPSTIKAWKKKKTKRPQFSSIAACWAAAGRKTINIDNDD